jgi:hypothetical protein
LVNGYQSSGGTWCSLLTILVLGSSEMLILVYQNIWHYSPEFFLKLFFTGTRCFLMSYGITQPGHWDARLLYKYFKMCLAAFCLVPSKSRLFIHIVIFLWMLSNWCTAIKHSNKNYSVVSSCYIHFWSYVTAVDTASESVTTNGLSLIIL